MNDYYNKTKNAMLSSIVCGIVTSPLEVIKSNMQLRSISNSGIISTTKDIYQCKGAKGFYKGFNLNVLCTGGFYTIFFPLYDIMKNNGNGHFTSSIIAASAGSFITNPFQVLKIRKQTNHDINNGNNNITIVDIVRKEGIASLYKGYAMTLLKNCELGLYMTLYEKLKENSIATPYATFISKFISLSITYPIDTIRTVFRGTNKTEMNLKEHLKLIIKKNGIKGIYQGYTINAMRSITNAVIIFSLYDYLNM